MKRARSKTPSAPPHFVPNRQWPIVNAIIIASLLTPNLSAQTAFRWQQIKENFEAANPTLKAARLNIDESRAAEITAYLRPNPDFTGTLNQIDPFTANPYRPLTILLPYGSLRYLYERQHRRELRLENAKKSTDIAASNCLDPKRGPMFNLRSAFVQTLLAKAARQNARENPDYRDRELTVNRMRFRAGDLALVDMDRLELQRVPFESDLEMATVNLRTAKIQLLMLLNGRTPVEQFDVAGPYDFIDLLMPLEEFQKIALETRPDLKAALQSVELANTSQRLG
jgi:cobalt-zinc-cadmium efflux system outer membrane protein